MKGELNPQSRQSRIWRYAPLVIWMAVIFFASTGKLSASNTVVLIQSFLRWFFPNISDERIAFFHVLLRKIGHFSEYAVLALLATHAFKTSSQTFLRNHWFVASLLLVVLYSLSDEYHQSFVPSRTASIYDSMIDSLGGLAALCLSAISQARRS